MEQRETDIDIDKRIAVEVMGAKLISDERNYRGCYEEYAPPLTSARTANVQWRDLQHYSEQIAPAYEMEEKIKERHLEFQYEIELSDITDAAVVQFPNEPRRTATMFDLIHATPKQRCLAALKTMDALNTSDAEGVHAAGNKV